MRGTKCIRYALALVASLAAAPGRAADVEMTYGGRLTEPSGKPYAGKVDLEVRFFDASAAGTQLGTMQPFDETVLSQGVFQITLEFSAAQSDVVFGHGHAVWIEVKDATHNKKYPRQRFGAVPYALKVPVDGMTIGWTANGELEVIGGGGGPIDGADIASGTVDAARLPGASGSTNGILSSADWNTFNGKQPFITAGGAGQYFAGNKTFQTLDTAAVAEHATNKYFTDLRAKTAAVANAITDNVTDVAPSQDAVFEKFQSLDTADIAEDPTALFFTPLRAKTAAVANSITDDVTDVAPSQEAVYEALNTKVSEGLRNVNGGFAGLNGSGLIDPAQIPFNGLAYQGVWDSAANAPVLPSPGSCGTDGTYYITNVGSTGVTTLHGNATWAVGDWVICSGAGTWQRVGSSSGISTINTKTGSTITLVTDDISDATSARKYYTDALARAAFSGTLPVTVSGGGVIGLNAATTGAAGSMSAADKTKLDGIAAGADDVNTANVAASGAVMDADYTGNGMIARSGAAGTYTLVANNAANWDIAHTDRLKWDGGATDLVPATARTSLGLVIGTNVQAADATLTGIAALSPTANQLVYASGADSFSTTALTLAGRNLLDDADNTAQRTTLGLGTIATQDASAVAITGGTMTGVTLTTPTFANDAISGDKVHGGTISNFASTGIDDNADALALTIDINERVGIGTAAPNYPLHILSADAASTSALVGNSSTGVAQIILDAGDGDGAGNDYFVMRQRNDLSALLYTAGGGGAINFAAGTTTPQVTLTTSGRLGIGTATPGVPLDVAGQIDAYDADAQIRIAPAAFGANMPGIRTMTNDPLHFGTNDANRMTISAAGYVGVGTTSPGRPLHVSAPSDATIVIENTVAPANSKKRFINTATTGDFSIGKFLDDYTGTVQLRIDNSGNVGIGTSSPGATLDVNGAIVSRLPATLIPAGTTQTLDLKNANTYVIDLGSATGNVTLTLSNPSAGGMYAIKVIQGATPRNIVWPAAVKWPGGTAPTISTANDAVDFVTLAYDSTNYYGAFGQNYQ